MAVYILSIASREISERIVLAEAEPPPHWLYSPMRKLTHLHFAARAIGSRLPRPRGRSLLACPWLKAELPPDLDGSCRATSEVAGQLGLDPDAPGARGGRDPITVQRQWRDAAEAAAAGGIVGAGRPRDHADNDGAAILILEHRRAGIAGAGA
jgi:hypothetical protein